MPNPTDKKTLAFRKDKSGKKDESPNHLKVLEFVPKQEEEEDDFGDLLYEIINAEEEDNNNFHQITFSKKGLVLSWCEEEDMMHAQVHNMTNMEVNYLLQRFLINIHLDLS